MNADAVAAGWVSLIQENVFAGRRRWINQSVEPFVKAWNDRVLDVTRPLPMRSIPMPPAGDVPGSPDGGSGVQEPHPSLVLHERISGFIQLGVPGPAELETVFSVNVGDKPVVGELTALRKALKNPSFEDEWTRFGLALHELRGAYWRAASRSMRTCDASSRRGA
ncbi:MAG: hypothetical protein U1F43_35030 [Myxococcota bacterium]